MINFYEFTVRGVTYTEPHEGQKKVLQSDARFKVVCCGRRFGKSVLAVNTLLEHALANSNRTYWYVGPTFRQAKTIAWRYLMSRIRMLPVHEQKRMKINETNLSVEFSNGSLLELKGVERPDNLLGTGLDGVVLDEYAVDTFGSYPIWKEIIRPSLSDRHGWAIFISTPRGYNHFFELFEYAKTNSEWDAWQMPSSINPVLTQEELDAAKAELGEDLFSQEYEAQFRKRSGLVYPEFSREIHIIDEVNRERISPRWTLEIGIDFGGSHPTAAVFMLFAQHDDTAYIVDEYYEANISSDKHLEALKAIENKWLSILKQHGPRVRWGDSQAKQLIMDYGRAGYHITPTIKGRDSVQAGIDEVKMRLNLDLVTKKPKMYITKNCVNTIREFENYVWITGNEGTVEEDEMMRLAVKRKDAPRKIFDDAMDAVRYVISHHVPIGSQGVVRRVNRYADPLTGI
jgi:phage terminase large subunit